MKYHTTRLTQATLILFNYCLLLTLISSNVLAQTVPLRSGEKVKILAPDVHSELLEGTIYDITSTDLYLNSGPYSFVISLDSIEELQTRTGQKRHTIAGAFIGLIGGGLLGGVLTKTESDECIPVELFDCTFDFNFAPHLQQVK